MGTYWVYIVSNKWNTTMYIGVTNDVERRSDEHKERKYPRSFTAKYGCTKLVWYEEYGDPTTAIAREKQLKNWKRDWKKELVSEMNPKWDDLSLAWTKDEQV